MAGGGHLRVSILYGMGDRRFKTRKFIISIFRTLISSIEIMSGLELRTLGLEMSITRTFPVKASTD